MTRYRWVVFAVATAIMVFVGWTIQFRVIAQDEPKEANVDEVEVMRQRLATICSIDDNERFMLEYWKLLALHRVTIPVKHGDRYVVGGGLLVERRDGKYALVSKDDSRAVFDKIAHVMTKQGSWEALTEQGLSDARHVIISTEDYVFLIDLTGQTVSIIER